MIPRASAQVSTAHAAASGSSARSCCSEATSWARCTAKGSRPSEPRSREPTPCLAASTSTNVSRVHVGQRSLRRARQRAGSSTRSAPYARIRSARAARALSFTIRTHSQPAALRPPSRPRREQSAFMKQADITLLRHLNSFSAAIVACASSSVAHWRIRRRSHPHEETPARTLRPLLRLARRTSE